MNKRNFGIYLLSLFILLTFLSFLNISKMNDFIVESCATDAIEWCSRQNALGLIMVPVTMIYVLNYIKYDFRTTSVIHFDSRLQLWKSHNIIFAKMCMVTVLASYGICIVWLLLSGKPLFNWNKMNSYYTAVTGCTGDGATVISSVLISIIMNIFIMMIIAVLSLLLYWKTGSQVIATIVVVIIGIWDGNVNYMSGKMWIYYGRVKFTYSLYVDQLHLFIRLLIVISAFILLYLVGKKMALKKEFL